MSKMKMPGFTAEASLFKASEYYHKTGMGIPGESMIQPAFGGTGCYSTCANWCDGDPDCLHCCRCVCNGGTPSRCCF